MVRPRAIRFDRRSVLRGTLCGTALASLRAAGVAASPGKTQRILVVAMSGGVRTKETLGTPDNVPNLKRLADGGVVYPRTRAANLGHFGATLALFTGVSEAYGIRENARGEDPTLFEYVRKDLGWGPEDVWVSTSGGTQEANVAYSLHPDYGQRFAANTLDGDGVFNADFKAFLERYGKPREMSPDELGLLDRMRGSIHTELPDGTADPEAFGRVERFLLDELKRGTQDLRGVGAADAKALRVARNLMAVFRPRLMAVVLRDADVAHANFNSYVQVLRRNDEMLGELLEAVGRDPELADTTSIFVLPEFGRDSDLNARRGLDHGDGSDDLRYVSLIASGPDFRKGAVVQEEVHTIDLCTTVCALLGANPRISAGRRLPKLLG